MQSAAGGTSQRLKPALAIVCSRSRIPAPPPDTVPALLIVVINSSPAAAHAGHVCQLRFRYLWFLNRVSTPTLLPHAIFRIAPGRKVHSQIPTPDARGYARGRCRPRLFRPEPDVPATQLNLRSPAESVNWDRSPSLCR